MRICSLVPSATEIVCALGLIDDLVGVSHRCDQPPEVVGKPVVSQLLIRQQDTSSGEIAAAIDRRQGAGHPIYELDADLLGTLRPDLILTQEICEVCAVPASLAEELARGLLREPSLVTINAFTLGDILGNIERLGVIAGRAARARDLVASLRARVDRVASRTAVATHRPRVAFCEWLDPPWIAGNWVPELIALAGGRDGLGAPGERSRKLSWSDIVADEPDILLIAPCGFSVERTLGELARHRERPEWAALPAVRAGNVYVLDGGLWSRHGPRLVDGLDVLARILHPELFPEAAPTPPVTSVARVAA